VTELLEKVHILKQVHPTGSPVDNIRRDFVRQVDFLLDYLVTGEGDTGGGVEARQATVLTSTNYVQLSKQV